MMLEIDNVYETPQSCKDFRHGSRVFLVARVEVKALNNDVGLWFIMILHKLDQIFIYSWDNQIMNQLVGF